MALEGEGEDADRLRALRSLRRKRTKPEDWMSGTFHQYDISDVVGAGTFGQVCLCEVFFVKRTPCALFECLWYLL